jgi:surface protein
MLDETMEGLIIRLAMQSQRPNDLQELVKELLKHGRSAGVGAEEESEVVRCLSVLERILSEKKKVSVRDIGAIEEAIESMSLKVITSFESHIQEFMTLWGEARETLSKLKENSDKLLEMQIQAIESKLQVCKFVTTRELNELKAMAAEEEEDEVKQDLVEQLHAQLASLHLCSKEPDTESAKRIIEELQQDDSTGGNERISALLTQLKEKVLSDMVIGNMEIFELRSHYAGTDNRFKLRVLEARLESLDILSMITPDAAAILQKEAQLMEDTEDSRSAAETSDRQLKEKRSRGKFLQRMVLSASSVKCETGGLLAKGRFEQEVRLGRYRGRALIAIKTWQNEKTFEFAENELLQMHYIGSHPNIVALFGYYRNEGSQCLHIVSEYAQHGTLAALLNDHETYPYFSTRQGLGWLMDLASAIEHIHGRNIKHGDIRPENLFVFDNFKVKLGGFVCATSKDSLVVMDNFNAPEVRKGWGIFFASDIYSWAMTAFQIFSRKPPVHGSSCKQNIQTAMTGVVLTDRTFYDVLRSLLVRCMNNNIKDRPSIIDLCDGILDIFESLDDITDLSSAEAMKTISLQLEQEKSTTLRLEKHLKLAIDACLTKGLRLFTNESLREAVKSLCSDRETALLCYGPVGEWNTSIVTDMSNLFCDSHFNDDISNWDVRSVTDMSLMFKGCSKFNQPLAKWNVSNVVNMTTMFYGASSFNQPLKTWNVCQVTNMSFLFGKTAQFNQSIEDWDVSNIIKMSGMFFGAQRFNFLINLCPNGA